MRKLLFSFLILSNLSNTALCQEHGKGVRFYEGNWKDLLATAKASGLPIFVDVYTDWCGPCKRMEKEIFILPEVGEFYNKHFINYRLNAEKTESRDLAKRYSVSAYPTWLFLEADGTLRLKKTDYMPAASFIDLAKTALQNDSVSKSLSALQTKFQEGERNNEFLQIYLQKLKTLQLDNTEILNAYVSNLKGKLQPEEIEFLVKHSGRSWSAAIPLITNNLKLLPLEERKKIASLFFDRSLYFVWGSAINSGDTTIAAQTAMLAKQIYPLLDENKKLNFDHTALFYYRKLKVKSEVKEIGYRLAEKQMRIDTAYARKKDKELLDQVMVPFLNGQQDSTKIPGFSEEKKLASKQYSSKVAVLLYEAAEAFIEALPLDDPAQRDAAKWAERAGILLPNKNILSLQRRFASIIR